MLKTREALAIAILAGLAIGAEPEPGSVCIAPVLQPPDPRGSPGLFCDSEKLSLKIDGKTIAWPIKESVKIDGLSVSARYLVVILCNGKPQQSFRFRFSDYETKTLCLFINDLYKTVNLAEGKRCPWCKCK